MMQRKPLNVHDFHPGSVEKMDHGTQGPVRNVFVIDGVERALFQQVHQIMRFNDKSPAWLKNYLETRDKILKLRDVWETCWLR